ncbi:GlxA family transcriptional regulator [Thalassospira marina]|uniref:AraC family transcriptional regulator n=1 Tax=Thalassospira marina TaxID=2048283 RepID=A0A2N3KT55_9PROT|nr:GlxA family transcriptional regulator [Thalassospira marina]PKR53653.1 AraC family transcriptional regulator [Thalassospira marina]
MLSVGFILHPAFSPMGLAALTAFDIANTHAGEVLYDVKLLSARGGPVRGSMGFSIETETLSDRYFDLLIIGGSMGDTGDDVVEFVRDAPRFCRRIASICTGAFVLAAAGLLDGRRATTHWAYAREMEQKYPKIKVEEDRIFIKDGPVWTSAGMTAGIDLALAFIEEDFGSDIARTVARKLVVYHRRTGGQTQFSTLLELEPKSDRIQKVLTYARRNLTNRLDVDELAGIASLSPRQFSRAFRTETGQSPARAIENLRLEVARGMMEDTNHSIDSVALQTGFADRDRMRRAFLRAYGQPPQTIRRATRAAMGEPDHIDA